jgi:hypothetical protein
MSGEQESLQTGRPHVCLWLRGIAILSAIGSIVILFTPLARGFVGFTLVLNAILASAALFGFARLIETVDRIERHLSRAAAMPPQKTPE